MLPAATTKALAIEAERKRLIAAGELNKARQTYRTQNVFLPDENTGEFWDEQFSRDDQVFPMEHWRIATVVSELDLNKSLLNLGVGRGVFEAALLKKGQPTTYLGTDITAETLKLLRHRFPTLTFKKAGLTALNPKQYHFDQITLLEVLEHIRPNQTFEVLEHIFKLLKPNGRFLVSVPINEGLEKMLPYNPNSHMRLYSEELLRFELEQVGFTVEKVYQASAFAKWFGVKHVLNTWFSFRKPNNLLMIAHK